ncbi:MAG: type I-C CRISPR-associated protein Cas5c [Elusimicrobiales bacterium]
MKGFCLEASGPYACFTRPEMKVERVSYDVITPSAARAIFDAVLWKPAIRWHIKKIEVLAPIKWFSIRRNEVGGVASPGKKGIYIEDDRQQRAGLILRDVKYRLHAEFEFIPTEKRQKTVNPLPENFSDEDERAEMRKDETPAKYAAMFERRAKKGQCFNQPYLGCREFAADVRLVDPQAESSTPINETRDLSIMLYDMDYADPQNPKPLFFRAMMQYGIITVPDHNSAEVMR